MNVAVRPERPELLSLFAKIAVASPTRHHLPIGKSDYISALVNDAQSGGHSRLGRQTLHILGNRIP